MQRLLLAISTLLLGSTALASSYTVDLQATGAPSHSFRQRVGTTIVDSWRITDVAAPPSGMTSWDVEITLPGPFQTAAAPGDVSVSIRCGWGGRSFADRQLVDGVADWQPVALVADRVEWETSGPGGDRNDLDAVFTAVPTATVLSSLTLSGTMESPVIVTSPTGRCDIEVRLDVDSFVDDQLLLEPSPVGLSEISSSIADDAQSAWEARFPTSTATPPDAVDAEARLTGLIDALNDGGCLVAPVVPDGLGGSYGGTVVTGASRMGPISDGELGRSTRTFGATLANGVTYGGAGLFSAYNAQRQVVALGSDGSFLAGRWMRLRGTTGVFHTVVATCDGAVDATTVLDTWFAGGLP